MGFPLPHEMHHEAEIIICKQVVVEIFDAHGCVSLVPVASKFDDGFLTQNPLFFVIHVNLRL